jgi:hypothetical protein
MGSMLHRSMPSSCWHGSIVWWLLTEEQLSAALSLQSMRAERELDLELLDAVTWPDYVWEWLRYMGAQRLLSTTCRLHQMTNRSN